MFIVFLFLTKLRIDLSQQVLTTTVPPGEQVVTEVGSFLFGSSGIETEVELTLCTQGGCGEGWQRICGGESCVKVILKNQGPEEGFVGVRYA